MADRLPWEEFPAALAQQLAAESGRDAALTLTHRLTWDTYRRQVIEMNRVSKDPRQTTGRRQFWRTLGRTLWRAQAAPTSWRTIGSRPAVALTASPGSPARVVVTFAFPAGNRGATDPVNLTPVVKALTDGMTDAGLAESDAWHTITGQDARRLAANCAASEVWLGVQIIGGRRAPTV